MNIHDAEQYPGWPMTIDQTDNYGRNAMAWLPTIRVNGVTDPVIQIFDETYDELGYSLRIRGTQFRPKVFRDGRYTIKIGEQPDRMKTRTGVAATAENDAVLELTLEWPFTRTHSSSTG